MFIHVDVFEHVEIAALVSVLNSISLRQDEDDHSKQAHIRGVTIDSQKYDFCKFLSRPYTKELREAYKKDGFGS